MRNLLFIFFLQIIPILSEAQVPEQQVVIYNARNYPIGIERQYALNDGNLFVRIYPGEVTYILSISQHKGDTLFVTEEYGHVQRTRSTEEIISGSGSRLVISGPGSDSVIVRVRRDSMNYDYTVPVSASHDRAFFDSLFLARVMRDEIKIPTDSLYPDETLQAWYVAGIPVRYTFSQPNEKPYADVMLRRSKNCLVYKDVLAADSVASIDSISWNKDSTRIRHTHIYGKIPLRNTYRIEGQKLISLSGQKQIAEVEYTSPSRLLPLLLSNLLVYSDELFTFYLHRESRFVASSYTFPDGKQRENKRNKKSALEPGFEEKQFVNGELIHIVRGRN